MLEVARRATVEGAPVGIELLFTVSEENALAGAKAFDASRLRSDFGYVFDHATPIGEVVVASPTDVPARGRVPRQAPRTPASGPRTAAARSSPPRARSPACRSAGSTRETTANVGSVHGGVGSTNVVPERCRLLAEARSLDPARVEDVVSGIVDAFHDGAAQSECDVDVVCEKLFNGYKVRAVGAGAGGGRGGAARVRLRAAADHDRRRLGRQRAPGRRASRA